ncbi:MAG: hypothetical protein ABIU77_03010 [Ferruginibacter sp.]
MAHKLRWLYKLLKQWRKKAPDLQLNMSDFSSLDAFARQVSFTLRTVWSTTSFYF